MLSMDEKAYKLIGEDYPGNRAQDMVLAAVQAIWRDQQLGLSPYNAHSHTGFLKHLMLRTGRDIETSLPQLMVNFVTSSYNPKLLDSIVEKIARIPEVVLHSMKQVWVKCMVK